MKRKSVSSGSSAARPRFARAASILETYCPLPPQVVTAVIALPVSFAIGQLVVRLVSKAAFVTAVSIFVLVRVRGPEAMSGAPIAGSFVVAVLVPQTPG